MTQEFRFWTWKAWCCSAEGCNLLLERGYVAKDTRTKDPFILLCANEKRKRCLVTREGRSLRGVEETVFPVGSVGGRRQQVTGIDGYFEKYRQSIVSSACYFCGGWRRGIKIGRIPGEMSDRLTTVREQDIRLRGVIRVNVSLRITIVVNQVANPRALWHFV